MPNQQDAIEILRAMSGQANVLTIPRLYINFMESVAGGLLLSQMLYWSDRGKDPNGWFYKTYREWEEEIALTQYQVSKFAKKMVKMGFLETKKARAKGSPTVHYRLNYGEFSLSIIKFLTMEHKETSQSLTETTSETTTDINTPPQEISPNGKTPLDPALHMLQAQDTGVSEETGPNPDDQWPQSSNKADQIHATYNGGKRPNAAQKETLVILAEQGPIDLELLETSYIEAGANWNPKYGEHPTLARVIEVYEAGGDYSKFAAKKWPKEEETDGKPTDIKPEQREKAKALAKLYG